MSVPSRIAGRGALLRSLRSLVKRTERFGEHRAASDAERRWAGQLYDTLCTAYGAALASPGAREALLARDARADRSRKVAGPSAVGMGGPQ